MMGRNLLRSFTNVVKQTKRFARTKVEGGASKISQGLISSANMTARSHLERAKMSSIIGGRTSVNDVELHYERTGIGEHTVLLLPGAMGSSKTDFLPQLERFNKELFTLVAWDPRGYGSSVPPERTWPLEFLQRDAEDAVELMKKLEEPTYSLVGWSDGGITALIIAAKYPERVNKVVVWGSNAFITEEDMKIYEGIRDIDKWSARMKQPYLSLYGEEYFRKHWSGWVSAFGNYCAQRQGDICKGDLKNVKCPTLIIHGQKDPMVVQAHAEYLNNNIADSRLHLMPNGKHNLHLRFVEEFNDIVENFLSE